MALGIYKHNCPCEGTTDHFMVAFEPHSKRQNACLALLLEPRTGGKYVIDPTGEPITIILVNGHTLKPISYDLLLYT